MTEALSPTQGIRVPHQTVTQANGQKLGNLLESDGFLAQFGTARKEAQDIWQSMSQHVQVETYPAGSAVTVGMAGDEMFGRGPRIPSPNGPADLDTRPEYMSSRLKFSAESLALFHEARNSFGW